FYCSINFSNILTFPTRRSSDLNTGVTFGGIVGSTALTSLDVTGATALNGSAITTSGTQAYHSATSLGADTILSTTNNGVSFDNTIDRAEAYTLVIIRIPSPITV